MAITAAIMATHYTRAREVSAGYASVTANSETHSAIVGPTQHRRGSTGYGGDGDDRLVNVSVLLSEWTSAPDLGDTITAAGSTYRVVDITHDHVAGTNVVRHCTCREVRAR